MKTPLSRTFLKLHRRTHKLAFYLGKSRRDQLGWKKGDRLIISPVRDGSFIIEKTDSLMAHVHTNGRDHLIALPDSFYGEHRMIRITVFGSKLLINLF